jgi:hypothetical protein
MKKQQRKIEWGCCTCLKDTPSIPNLGAGGEDDWQGVIKGGQTLRRAAARGP